MSSDWPGGFLVTPIRFRGDRPAQNLRCHCSKDTWMDRWSQKPSPNLTGLCLGHSRCPVSYYNPDSVRAPWLGCSGAARSPSHCLCSCSIGLKERSVDYQESLQRPKDRNTQRRRQHNCDLPANSIHYDLTQMAGRQRDWIFCSFGLLVISW